MIKIKLYLLICCIFLSCAGQQPTLTSDEAAQGWELLFDGKTFEGWRGFKRPTVPEGWHITKKGELYFDGNGGGDIMTREQFSSFELSLEWKISPGGNSGIIYRVGENRDTAWQTGPEMQVLDNNRHKDGEDPKTSAGSNYALHAPTEDVTKEIGRYNEARILVKGSHVEHWLNGTKLLEYEIESPEWEQLVANSKFSEYSNYGRIKRGHIVLQDHGDEVWFRNIKIRKL